MPPEVDDVVDPTDTEILNDETPGEADDEPNDEISSDSYSDDPDSDDSDSDDDSGDTKESDEDEEKEEDEKDESEEELDRPSYKEIKAKYPDFFKEFPKFNAIIHREQQFTQVFPTPAEAKVAANAQVAYESIRELVLDGNAEGFLSELGEADKGSVGKFASNFLPSLAKVDKQTYIDVTTPVIRNVIHNIFKHGEALGTDEGKNYMNAAKVAHFALFNNYDLGKPDKTETPKDEALEEDKKNFFNTKYNELYTSVSTDLDKALDAEVERGLDPTNSLKPGLKKILLKEIKNEVTLRMQSDESHMQRMSLLWKREARNGFSGTLKDSIKNTFLSRAKQLIPEIRKAKRAEIFEDQKKTDTSKSDNLKNRKRVLEPGRASTKGGKVVSKMDARKMSDMDILNS